MSLERRTFAYARAPSQPADASLNQDRSNLVTAPLWLALQPRIRLSEPFQWLVYLRRRTRSCTFVHRRSRSLAKSRRSNESPTAWRAAVQNLALSPRSR